MMMKILILTIKSVLSTRLRRELIKIAAFLHLLLKYRVEKKSNLRAQFWNSTKSCLTVSINIMASNGVYSFFLDTAACPELSFFVVAPEAFNLVVWATIFVLMCFYVFNLISSVKFLFKKKAKEFLLKFDGSADAKPVEPAAPVPEEKVTPGSGGDSTSTGAGVPKKGQDPEWDAFLRAVLEALGVTVGEISGALLYEIWNLYVKLRAGGDPFTLWKLFSAAVEALLGVLPLSMPFFLFVAVIVFTYRMIVNDLAKKKVIEEAEKKILEDQKRILEKLEKLVDDNKKESLVNRVESWKKEVKKWLRGLVAGAEKKK